MSQVGKQLAQIALEIGAITLSPQKPYTWASGYRMPIYNDNRKLLCRAEYRALVAQGFEEIIKEKNITVEVVAGTATAGIPHSTTLADRIKKPLVYVRSASKEHGLQNQIEGILNPGAKTLIIEDLVSTGGSSVAAVTALRDKGAVVDHCLSVFSYGLAEAQKLFDDQHCGLHSLLTFETLLEVASAQKAIDSSGEQLLAQWRKDPFGWGETNGFPRVQKS